MKNSLRLILLAIMSLVILNVSATERLTAVLQHNDTPRAFYGDSAFIQAVEAAESGDQIMLSKGTFTAPNTIAKALKIQGIGINTIIQGTVIFEIPTGQTGLYLEGLHFSSQIDNKGYLSDAIIKRCNLKNINLTVDSKSNVNNCEIYQCSINEFQCSHNSTTNLYIHNCYINSDAITSDAIIDRCVIGNLYRWQLSSIYCNNHSIKNSIIKNAVSNLTGMRYINVLYSDTQIINENIYQENVTQLSKDELNALFKSTDTYELTDEAAARYVFDGSQIGAYGGSTPYTLVPSIPQITSATVPSTVNADGQMQISFTVEAHE